MYLNMLRCYLRSYSLENLSTWRLLEEEEVLQKVMIISKCLYTEGSY